MACGEGRTERGASPKGRPRDPRRGRAVLLLSLIVLVWYAGVTAYRLPGSGSGDATGPAEGTPAVAAPGGGPGPAGAAAGGSAGPLNVRQKYLLGGRVDINRAGFREISELPGITDGTARAVVEIRARRGGFRRPEELLAVPGIKEKRLKKILPFLAGFHNN